MSAKLRINITRSSVAIFLALLALFAPSSARATILINEAYVNQPGGADDNREFIELISTTGGVESMAGLTLVLVDSEGPKYGKINDAYKLENYSTGTNGLLMIGDNYDVAVPGPLAGPWNSIYDPRTVLKDPSGVAPYSGFGIDDLTNNGLTLLLVTGYTGNINGTDYDTNDDGVFDSTFFTSIVDSIGWRQGDGTDKTFSPADLSQNGFTPDAVARRSDDMTPNSAAAWYGGDVVGTGLTLSYDGTQNFNLPAGATITPGYANFPSAAPEPATGILALLAALGLTTIGSFRRRQQ